MVITSLKNANALSLEECINYKNIRGKTQNKEKHKILLSLICYIIYKNKIVINLLILNIGVKHPNPFRTRIVNPPIAKLYCLTREKWSESRKKKHKRLDMTCNLCTCAHATEGCTCKGVQMQPVHTRGVHRLHVQRLHATQSN